MTSQSIILLLDVEASGDLDIKGKGQGSNSSLKRTVFFPLNCKICTNFSVDSYSHLYATPNVLQKMSNSYLHVHKDKQKSLAQVAAAKDCN